MSKLTEAQKSALKYAQIERHTHSNFYREAEDGHQERTFNSLIKKGCMHEPMGNRYWLTEKGIAMRDYLQDNH